MRVLVKESSSGRYYIYLEIPHHRNKDKDSALIVKHIGSSWSRASKEANRYAQIYECPIHKEMIQ